MAFGFSTRALTHALCMAGFRVISVDAFGDSDMQEFAHRTHILSRWGDPGALNSLQTELANWCRSIEKDSGEGRRFPVFLAGGCENWLDSIQFLTLESQWQVLGPSPSQTVQIRSPLLWWRAAAHSGLRFPASFPIHSTGGAIGGWHPSCSILPISCSGDGWLIKPFNGSAGAAIRSLPAGAIVSSDFGPVISPDFTSSSHYLQRQVAGRVIGATCIVGETCHQESNRPRASRQAQGDCFLLQLPNSRLIGVTESWSGEDFPGPSEYVYRGSWGPIQLKPEQISKIEQACAYLGCQTGVRGWLQMDLIEDSDGSLWMLEVNPRWSSGMEILARSGWHNPVISHALAWGGSGFNEPRWKTSEWEVSKSDQQKPSKFVGKIIYYARDDILLSERLIHRLNSLCRDRYADIPSRLLTGSVLPAGAPVLTAIAEISAHHQKAPDHFQEGSVRNRLKEILTQRAAMISRLLAEG